MHPLFLIGMVFALTVIWVAGILIPLKRLGQEQHETLSGLSDMDERFTENIGRRSQ